jgi:hypothetical protein
LSYLQLLRLNQHFEKIWMNQIVALFSRTKEIWMLAPDATAPAPSPKLDDCAFIA